MSEKTIHSLKHTEGDLDLPNDAETDDPVFSSKLFQKSGLKSLMTAAIDTVLPQALVERPEGTVSIVVIVVPDPTWIGPVVSAWRSRFPAGWKVIDRDGSSKLLHRADVGGQDLLSALTLGFSVVGVATDVRLLPTALTACADHTLSIRIDDLVLARAITAFTGGAKPAVQAPDVSSMDLFTVAAGFRPGSTAEEIVERVRFYRNKLLPPPPADAVDLRDAVEFGAAQEWGLQLVDDFARWQRGELPWSSVNAASIFFGPPGTGKTTLARSIYDAIASVSRVPVRFASASMADLFASTNGYLNEVIKEARRINTAAAPAVIFWDEADSLGSRRNSGDHNEQYFATLLSEFLLSISAARRTEGIVLLGATNFLDRIDPALRRPGRFDRSIYVGTPDAAGTAGIARRHLRGDLATIDLSGFAITCSGRTAAQIEAVVRDARTIARKAGRKIELTDLMDAALPPSSLSGDDLWRVCVHEAGHCVLALALDLGEIVTVVVGMSPGSHGETISRRHDGLTTRVDMERRGCMIIGGRCAELVLLGECVAESGGSDDSDLALLTELLSSFAHSTGLGSTLAYLGSPQEAVEIVRHSPALRGQVERHMRAIETRTVGIITEHRNAVERIAAALQARRYLTGEQIRELFHSANQEIA